MRWTLLVLAACGSSPSPKPATPPAPADRPITNVARGCSDAAHGLEGATKSVREPDQHVFEALKKRCTGDSWPSTAIECFATMREGDLGRCSRDLVERSREGMFAVIGGSEPSRAGLLVARARLEQLEVGVPKCDEFVTAVSAVLACEAMPLETRVNLGNETAQFWSLPTARLGADDLQRISEVCGQSLMTLEQQATGIGCLP
jgi:hypothetical protein